MKTHAALPAVHGPERTAAVAAARIPPVPELSLCHFSILQTRLKSRSFHMQCLPLAESGIPIRYVSPAPLNSGKTHDTRIQFVQAKRPPSLLRRLLPHFSLLLTLLRQKAALYHFQEPELLPLAFLLKFLFRKRIIYDAYEDFPAMMLEKLRFPSPARPIAKKIVSVLERAAARFFDGIITADPSTMRRLARAPRSRKLVFYNFPNLNLFPSPAATPRSFDLIYRGGLSQRAGTYQLLDALHVLACEGRRATLLLVSYFDNAAAEHLLRLRIRALGLESQIEIRPRLDHHLMAATLAEARIGLCPLQPVPKFLSNIPVKVFEYWACGLPVIASDLPPIRPFFRQARAGLLYEPSFGPGALAGCIRWLLDHPHDAEAIGARGRQAVVSRFNNQAESHKLRRFCERIALS